MVAAALGSIVANEPTVRLRTNVLVHATNTIMVIYVLALETFGYSIVADIFVVVL